jgi:uncharacterized protein
MSGETTPAAAWRHRDARDGFEVVFVAETPTGGRRLTGHVAAGEAGVAWAVQYEIVVDAAWRTRTAWIQTDTAAGRRDVRIEADGAGRWRVDGAPAPALDGCLDVDLEASSCTNAFPVQRLGLALGAAADAPAAFVRVLGPAVERLEQRYERFADDAGGRRRFHYVSLAFAFEAVLVYDASGFVVDYPGIAVRVL